MADASDPLTQLSRMSLEELAQVEVTSVSKSAQSLASAPASIYVITHEEIQRSGVLSDSRGAAPRAEPAGEQLNSRSIPIGARGFAGAPDVQNFSNKILMLIDGRSVYSPLFSGIDYDMQDVLMDDVDRIEVISGPGATLWGANAMNGVINIITRKAQETHGGLVRLEAAQKNRRPRCVTAAIRRGGGFRVYAKWFDRGASELAERGQRRRRLAQGADGIPRGRRRMAGNQFHRPGRLPGRARRIRWRSATSASSGANLLGRWEHAGDASTTRTAGVLRSHRPRTSRRAEWHTTSTPTTSIFSRAPVVGARHHLVWGLGRRYNDYHTVNNDLAFVPDHRTLELTNVFVQDTITLSEELKLTAGIKFEDNSYSDWARVPDLRLSWAPNDKTLFWLAGSRAIRSPTPFDTDVQEFVGGQLFVLGDPDFKTEKVTAYELGYRGNPDAALSLSASAFYNEYDDLRTIEITPGVFLPLRWGNLMEGSAYGFEAWADIQVTPWWRLSPGFRSLHKRLEFSEGASGLVGVRQAGNDPSSRYYLKSSMDLRPLHRRRHAAQGRRAARSGAR